MLIFDHIAVAGETLEAAQAHVEAALGVPLQAGGVHQVFSTHNALLGLEEDLYLEAIAVDPGAVRPARARWFDLDRFSGGPRLTNWICRTEDIDSVVARLPGVGEPVALARGDLRWRMAVPETGILPFDNLCPAVIQWDVDMRPPARLDRQGVRLTGLTVSHPEAGALEDLLRPLLNDTRVTFTTGPAGLSAAFETPKGERRL